MNRVTTLLLGVGLVVPGLLRASVDTAWVRRYDGPAHGQDWATCLAVDSLGNVYVAGTSSSDTSSNSQYLDFVTIKYLPSGDTAWVRRADFGGKDIPYGIGVDAQGNVYVAGTNSDSRMVTVKYSPTGQRLWYQLFGSQGGASDLALDPMGNAIVCGSTLRTTSDAATVKYRPNGDTAWATYFDWAGDEDYAMALAIAQTGDVAVTGFGARAGTHYDATTAQYDSSGNRLWAVGYDGPNHGVDRAMDAAADRFGNVAVTGHADNGYGTPPDYLTIKYSPLGETLWTRRYNGPADDWDEAHALALDSGGGVYVTGASAGQGSNYWDWATVKYTSYGTRLWAALYDGAAHSVDEANSVVVDHAGSAYVTGGARVLQYVSACVTIKYSPGGDTVWVASYLAPPSTPVYGTVVTVGTDGSVYVAGRYDDDVLTIKFVQDGGVQEKPASAAPELTVGAVPNPVLSRTTVEYGLPGSGTATLQVFDMSGRAVRVLQNGLLTAGRHSVIWDATDNGGKRVSSGVYMVVLNASGVRTRVKVTVLD